MQAGQKRRCSVDAPPNLTAQLLQRQLWAGGGVWDRSLHRRQCCTEAGGALRGAVLRQEFDSWDSGRQTALSMQARRSRVSEIIAAEGLLMVLCHSGACSAFCRGE